MGGPFLTMQVEEGITLDHAATPLGVKKEGDVTHGKSVSFYQEEEEIDCSDEDDENEINNQNLPPEEKGCPEGGDRSHQAGPDRDSLVDGAPPDEGFLSADPEANGTTIVTKHIAEPAMHLLDTLEHGSFT